MRGHTNRSAPGNHPRRSTRKRACLGKVRYPTKLWALQALDSIAQTADRPTYPIETYFCRACKGWHLTSKATRDA